MKRISRSLLSLCLAFVLCAALLPNGSVAEAATDTAQETFMITGYDVSSSSIMAGNSVDITLYLYRTDGVTGDISVIRGVDSFQGNSTYYAQATNSSDNTNTYVVRLQGLTYTGASEKELLFTIYYNDASSNGHYQEGKVSIRELSLIHI